MWVETQDKRALFYTEGFEKIEIKSKFHLFGYRGMQSFALGIYDSMDKINQIFEILKNELSQKSHIIELSKL